MISIGSLSGMAVALGSVILISIALAGDNAIAVALAAGRLPPPLRRRVIAIGTAAATALRIALATVAVQLLAIVGLTLAGGILLLYVAWKLYRDLRLPPGDHASRTARPYSLLQALFRIILADLSMSLDNVLAVAGAARDNFAILALGMAVSAALMAFGSDLLARQMDRHRWIGWVGLIVITFVAVRMIRDGGLEIAPRLLSFR